MTDLRITRMVEFIETDATKEENHLATSEFIKRGDGTITAGVQRKMGKQGRYLPERFQLPTTSSSRHSDRNLAP